MLTKIQEMVVNHFEKNRFPIVLHSRQTGIWYAAADYAVHYAISNPNKNVIIASPRFDSATETFTKVKGLVDNNHKAVIKKNTDKIIELNNGSKIIKTVMHNHTNYGYSVDMLIMTDFALGANHVSEKFYKNIFPSIIEKPDSRIIICSNPNGYNFFYKLFQQAERGENIFAPLRVYYWMNSNLLIDNDWIEEKIKVYGEDNFNEQYNLCFKIKK